MVMSRLSFMVWMLETAPPSDWTLANLTSMAVRIKQWKTFRAHTEIMVWCKHVFGPHHGLHVCKYYICMFLRNPLWSTQNSYFSNKFLNGIVLHTKCDCKSERSEKKEPEKGPET